MRGGKRKGKTAVCWISELRVAVNLVTVFSILVSKLDDCLVAIHSYNVGMHSCVHHTCPVAPREGSITYCEFKQTFCYTNSRRCLQCIHYTPVGLFALLCALSDGICVPLFNKYHIS